MSVYDARGSAISTFYDVSGNVIQRCFGADGTELTQNGYDLVVMTFNVKWFQGINAQLDMMEEIFSTYVPDLIGIQEAPNSLSGSIPSALFSGYRWQYLINDSNDDAILSKNIRFFDIVKVNYTTQAIENKYYTKCRFRWREKTICWINTHVVHKRTAEAISTRIAQMQELLAVAETEDYVIITGDMNTGAMSMDAEEWIGTYKPFIDAGYNLSNCDTRWGFTKTYSAETSAESLDDFTYPTDNIITSGDIDIVNRIIDTTKLSYQNGSVIDHVPVIAYLKIN